MTASTVEMVLSHMVLQEKMFQNSMHFNLRCFRHGVPARSTQAVLFFIGGTFKVSPSWILAPSEFRTVGMGSFLDDDLTSYGPYILIDSSTLTVDIVDICHVHDRLQRRVQYSKIMVSRCDQ